MEENPTPFTLHCILCGNADEVSLDLEDLRTFRCRSCEEEFCITDVRDRCAEWARVLKWLDQVPAKD